LTALDTTTLAADIYRLVGPKGNILIAENCMTRLRLQLKKKDTVSLALLKKMPGVLGLNEPSANELQIILGPGRAAQVTDAFQKLLKLPVDVKTLSSITKQKPQIGDGHELHSAIRTKNATPGKLFLKHIASIFMPIIPAFIGCGLITGLLNVILKIDPSLGTTASVQLLQIAGNAAFWGINIFVGINAAKEFEASPILGGVMAVIITHPGLSSISLFDEMLVPGRGGIMAVLLVVAFSSWLEKKLHHIIPEMFDLFLTPLFVILISTFTAIFLLQPLGGMLSEGIGYAATAAIGKGGAFTGFILAGTFLPLVMTGLHQGLTPIHAELIARTGVTILLPILAMAGAGQVGAAIAVYFKTKNSQLKKTIASALPVGLMGIGEPLIYGVTLPLGKPFIGACIGAAFGGTIQAANVVGSSALGISGLPLAACTDNIPIYLLGLIVAYAGGFIATWIIGFDDPE